MSLKYRQFTLFAIPVRVAVAQIWAAILVLSAVIIMGVAQHGSDSFAQMRLSLAQSFSPVIHAIQEPAVMFDNWMGQMQTASVLSLENQALSEEVLTLREWHAEAVRLRAENHALRDLLAMKQPHEIRSATGQALMDQGSSYSHSLLVQMPNGFFLERGMVAMNSKGMVGRVVNIDNDEAIARVLMLDDPASRIPVMLSQSGHQAILSGQQKGWMLLDHLAPNATPKVGEMIVTAGQDGLLPAGLPLAKVVGNKNGRTWAQPLAPMDQLNWLRLVDFGTITALKKPNFQQP